MYVREVRVFGFKQFLNLCVKLSPGINIVVGDNDAGKTTLLEAVNAVLNGQYRGVSLTRNLSEDLFNDTLVDDYKNKINSKEFCSPPEINIEVVFDSDNNEDDGILAFYEGDSNSRRIKESGVSLKIALDSDSFADEYQKFVNAQDCFGIPIEYYSCVWSTFARKVIRPVGLKFKSSMIGNGHSLVWNNSRAFISRITKDVLDSDDQIHISQVQRKLKKQFTDDTEIKRINDKISDRTNSLTRKSVTLGFESGTINSWENDIVTKLQDIPFANVGDGTKSIVATELALARSKDRHRGLVLLEEPENHLSHTRLNMFLDDIRNRCAGMQLVVTTHSSFVANKLELRKLILLNGNKTTSLSELRADTSNFFMKAPGYKTLRVLLCRVSILVEGDADELIVQRAYQDRYGKLPIQDGIDVIAVGTSFLRFLEIAKKIGKDVVAVTDNDGNPDALDSKYREYCYVASEKACDAHQVVSYEKEIRDDGKYGSLNYNTLESEIYLSADKEVLSQILGRSTCDRDETLKYMESNKTEVALKIFETKDCIAYPDYIVRAIEWAHVKAGLESNV